MKIHLSWSLIFAVVVVLSGCEKKVPVVQQDPKVAELEAKVAALEAQLHAATPSPTPQPTTLPEDDAARLKRLLRDFPDQLGEEIAIWKVISYDIRKTDSLVSPLVASVVLDYGYSRGDRFRDRLVLVAQDGRWQIKQMVETPYHEGREPLDTGIPVTESDDPRWVIIQNYLQ